MNLFKSILSSVWSIILVLLLALIWYEAYHAYIINHTYYYDMLADSNNRSIIIRFIILSIIPLGTLLWTKSISLSKIWRSSIISLILSWFIHTSFKWGLVWSTGSFIFLFNTIILLSLVIIFFWGIYAIGTIIYNYVIKKEITERTDILLALWVGLALFLLFNYILIVFQVFYPIFSRLQFIFLWYAIRYYKKSFYNTKNIINNICKDFFHLDITRKWIYSILLIVTLLYIMFSWNLSYIPYSTAWDANHAYMYFPKIWALNNGVFFTEGPIITPYIWMVYISYWFSLFQPFTSFTIAPDTVAVIMNSISWWLSLLFWLGALYKIVNFFNTKINKSSISFFHTAFSLGWMYFLLWLMSGMWAFLVFVDNKTDLGVMSLTMLALMSWFIFIEHVWLINKKTHTLQEIKNYTRYGIISGIFFALAIMAKPTAFQDFLIFGLLLVGLWIWTWWLFGLFMMVLGILWRAETMSIVFYINKNLATKFWIIGLWATIWQGILTFKQQSFKRIKPISLWATTIFLLLIIFKWWYVITQQIISNSRDAKTTIKSIFLGGNDNKKTEQQKISSVLLADSGDSITIESLSGSTNNITPSIKPEVCTLSQAGLSSDALYSGLWTIQWWGLIEDLWRYIWFWQRVFSDPKSRTITEKNNYWFVHIGYPILKIFFHNPGCYSFNTVADTLCEQPELTRSQEALQTLLDKLDNNSNQYKFLHNIIESYNIMNKETDPNRQQASVKDIQKSLTDYIQWNVIQVSKDNNGYISIAIPYAFLTPLNVIFNRSLQNLSSYYTDIGFIWILSFVLLISGTIYALFKRDEKLLILHIVTLCGWIIWWFIASGIIWYAVGIIAWTLFCNGLYISNLNDNKDDNTFGIRIGKIVIGIIVFSAIIQTGLNIFRIASQGWSWPFTWYKWWTGKENIFIFTAQWLQQKEITRNSYKANDVFNIQFGHYNPFLSYVKDRKDEDGILIAGTYLQYFLKNQNNIIWDWLLTEFWKRGSDENTCNLALRLQDKKIKYIVIDPNIWSVVMGGWNASLFDRFVAKIDSKTNKILTHGTMTMLAKMIEDKYLKLIMTNNMWAKYAYTLTDKELQDNIQALWDEITKSYLMNAFLNEPLLFRSKLAVPRFFGEESQYYFILIWSIFQQRLSQNIGIDDLANILGKEINEKNMLSAIQAINTPNQTSLVSLNKQLTDDERTVIGYYTAITQRQKTNDTKWVQEIVSQLLQASLAWGSQLITFELQI